MVAMRTMVDRLTEDLASLRIDRGRRGRRNGPSLDSRSDGSPPEGGTSPRRTTSAATRRLRVLGLGALLSAGIVALGLYIVPRIKARLFTTEVATGEVALLSPSQAATTLTSTGYTPPQGVSKVGAKIQARISRVLIKEGDSVKTGQLLAELEGAELTTQLLTATRRVLAARARAQTARANVVDAFPERRFRGIARELGKRVDKAKATVRVKVAFVDVDDLADVLPDMSARVSFLTEELSPEALRERTKLVVPAAAVVTRGGDSVVFVVDGSGRAVVHSTRVTVGAPLGDSPELPRGSVMGTRVVLDPPPQMADGQPVALCQP
jgi:multidrug efflux pump subunit AcrA (membrane-fusion protein)